MRVGIVGCGRVSEYHIKFLSEMKNVTVVALADKNLQNASQLSKKYNIFKFYSSIKELIDESDVDIVHITVPPQFHQEIAMFAISRGVHVFIEKPMTLSLCEAQELFDLAEKNNVKISVNYIHLFNPIVLDMKNSLRRIDCGRLLFADCYMAVVLDLIQEVNEAIGLHWSYELPGGIIHNYITHPIYLILDWIGNPQKLSAFPCSFGAIPQRLTDHMDVLLEGENANARISVSMAGKQEEYYLKLFFERATVSIDFITQTVLIEKARSIPRVVGRVTANFDKSWQLSAGSILNVIKFLRKKIVPYQGLKHLISDYYDSIRLNTTTPISKDLIIAVTKTEEEILKCAGRVHFVYPASVSTQRGISKNQKILVTGATGYLGREVIRQLVDAGYFVRAYVRKSSRVEYLSSMGIELVYGDLREMNPLKSAVENIDIIIHLGAALKGSAAFIKDTTIIGTKNISEAAKEADVKRVIYISSFSVYDYSHIKDNSYIIEETMLETRPELRGVYSEAKRQAEEVALSSMRNDRSAWTILRPSLIFGNGRDILSLIGSKIGIILLSFGRSKKHLKLIHVRDVAKAILSAVDNESTKKRIFNITHEDAITVKKIESMYSKRNPNRKLFVIHVPYALCRVANVLLNIMGLLYKKVPNLNKSRLAYLCRDLLANSQSFRKVTGWQPEESLTVQLEKEIHRVS